MENNNDDLKDQKEASVDFSKEDMLDIQEVMTELDDTKNGKLFLPFILEPKRYAEQDNKKISVALIIIILIVIFMLFRL